MASFAVMGMLDVWYERVDAKAALRTIGRRPPAPVRSAVAGSASSDVSGGAPQVDGAHRRGHEADRRPSSAGVARRGRRALRGRLGRGGEVPATLESDRRALLERFELVDLAWKVVGVGSVGTRCFVALFMSDLGDPLFLQVKEAGPFARGPVGAAPSGPHRRRRGGRDRPSPSHPRPVVGGWWADNA